MRRSFKLGCKAPSAPTWAQLLIYSVGHISASAQEQAACKSFSIDEDLYTACCSSGGALDVSEIARRLSYMPDSVKEGVKPLSNERVDEQSETGARTDALDKRSQSLRNA